MNDFLNNIKQNFKSSNVVIQLIYINTGIFVASTLLKLSLLLFNISDANSLLTYTEVPANIYILLHQPWSIFTYMFMHLDFFHILFNMICLYWFGKIFLQFLSEKQLVAVYIISGIGGALTYIAAYNFFPYFEDIINHSYLLGASASVMGIMLTAALMAPNFKVRLLLIGEVKLITLALIMIALSVLQVTSSNAGGQFAHIGGALFGYIYFSRLKKGKDLSKPVTSIINTFVNAFKKGPKPKNNKYYNAKKTKTDAQYNQERKQNNDSIDKILDKIKQSGYNSLSDSEKKQLFDKSKKI